MRYIVSLFCFPYTQNAFFLTKTFDCHVFGNVYALCCTTTLFNAYLNLVILGHKNWHYFNYERKSAEVYEYMLPEDNTG